MFYRRAYPAGPEEVVPPSPLVSIARHPDYIGTNYVGWPGRDCLILTLILKLRYEPDETQ